jgi:hypothetical protein
MVLSSAVALSQPCKHTSFTGKVIAEESYSYPFAPGLSLRLKPLKEDWGWIVSIGDEGSDEDWSYPVTFPIRSGEQQVIGTGYGETVQEKMKRPTVVEFVLNHADFVEYSKLADDTLNSPRPEAAGEFIEKIAKLPQGQVTVTPLTYGKGVTPETIKWMKFKVAIVVPAIFQSTLVSWSYAACPGR